MQNHRHTIRNIDPELIMEARIYALQTGMTLGELINSSLEWFMSEDDGADEPIGDPSLIPVHRPELV